jgi:hypothetical protein
MTNEEVDRGEQGLPKTVKNQREITSQTEATRDSKSLAEEVALTYLNQSMKSSGHRSAAPTTLESIGRTVETCAG